MIQYQSETQQFVDDLKTGQNNILVAIRVRPLNQKEQSTSEFQTIRILDGKVIILLDPVQEFNQDDVLRKNRIKETQFAFDYVFDEYSTQQSVYEQTTDFLMVGLLDGYNATIFSYGATGSGKTFTMIGSPQEQGIMPRSMQNLFQSLQSDKLSQFKDVSVKVSYLEIYNENIKDLLTTEDKNLDVREDKNAGIVIAGLTEVDVKGVAEVMALLKVGNKNRSKEATEANLFSSRSHAILQVQIDCREKHQGIQDQLIQSKLSLVDLAGSERAANTNNKGIRMVEGAKINQSLLVLGNCIQALSEASEKSDKKQFIPYRNSKLTRLLKDSLGGNCRTVMISNVSPSVAAFDETYNTLVYANRAKNIKTVVNRNVLNAQNHISSYAEMIKNLRIENEELKHLISNNQQQQPPPSIQKYLIIKKEIVQKTSNHPSNQSQDLENSLTNNYQELNELNRKINEMEDKEDNFQSNLLFLQQQHRTTKDQLEQLKVHDRMDNCVTQISIIQKTNKDLQRQYDEVVKKKDNLSRIVESYEETAYRNYLVGMIKQGDLQMDNLKIRQLDKRNRVQTSAQEQQIQNLKNQLKPSTKTSTQNSEYTKLVLPNLNNTKNIIKPYQPTQLIPGVNSPYPKYQLPVKQTYNYAQKKNLKLPPVNLLNINKINGKRYLQSSINNITNSSVGNRLNYYNNQNGNRYQSQQQRSPFGPIRSSKSAKARNGSNYNITNTANHNKSLDYHNTSDEQRNQYSVKRLKQMHDQYQAQRFQRAFSGKRNQNSMPQLNNKILMPGMVHESPYVKNFQKDQESLEVKRERLKRLNINHKGEQAIKYTLN